MYGWVIFVYDGVEFVVGVVLIIVVFVVELFEMDGVVCVVYDVNV